MEDKNKQLMLGVIRIAEIRGLTVEDFEINNKICNFKLKWKSTLSTGSDEEEK